MAFLQPYGTGFGYSGFPAANYTFAPTAFAAAPAHEQASQHGAEGSQAGESQSQAADHNAALFGQWPGAAWGGYGAPVVYGQPTVLPGAATVLPSTTLVPVAAPRVRRPGYNERLIAWRNRQKAFNRYKKATKEAIKNANRQQQFGYGYGYAAPATTVLPGATVFGAAPFGAPAFGAPYGATYISGFPGAGVVYPQAVATESHDAGYNNFDYSQGGAEQHQEAQEEPEIRGTQV